MHVRAAGQNQRSNSQRIRKICTEIGLSAIRDERDDGSFFSGTNIGSFRWNDKNSMLAGIADGKINVWLYPDVVFIDPSLLEKTIYRIESK